MLQEMFFFLSFICCVFRFHNTETLAICKKGPSTTGRSRALGDGRNGGEKRLERKDVALAQLGLRGFCWLISKQGAVKRTLWDFSAAEPCKGLSAQQHPGS